MREVSVSEITKNIREMCIEANHFLSPDMKQVFDEAVSREESPLGKQILNQLEENLRIAGEDMIPICQDTGMAVVFVKAGQEVHFTGGSLTEAVNEGQPAYYHLCLHGRWDPAPRIFLKIPLHTPDGHLH